MTDILHFEPVHLSLIADRDAASAHYLTHGENLMKTHRHNAYSAVREDRVVGCAGIIFGAWEGKNLKIAEDEAYIWAILSSDVEKWGLWFHRMAIRYFRANVEAYKPRRVWAEAWKENARNCRWLSALGFKQLGAEHDAETDHGIVARFVYEGAS